MPCRRVGAPLWTPASGASNMSARSVLMRETRCMTGRFFLDTNVFIYTFDSRVPAKRTKAAQLIRRAVDTGQGIVSYQVVGEFLNVALRRFSPAVTVAEAEQYLITVFRPILAVQSSPAIFLEALRIAAKHELAWYDSVIVAAAIESRCDVLYSEHLQAGRNIENLRIENPFTWRPTRTALSHPAPSPGGCCRRSVLCPCAKS
jgi:predicted nucleic acid-binding protein